jgi:hypothetical protein
MKTNQKMIILVIAFVLLVVIALGVSYAFFTANIGGQESSTSITVAGGTMNITYNGGPDITINDAYPRGRVEDYTDQEWASKTFTVTGNNSTDADMYYQLKLIIDADTFSSNFLSYRLISENTSSNGTIIKSFDSSSGPLVLSNKTNIFLGTGKFSGKVTNAVHTYTIKFFFLDDENIDQNTEQGAIFKAHIGIEGTALKFAQPGVASASIMNLGNYEIDTGGLREVARPATDQLAATTEYRYMGSNPNNYVSFSGELWRMLGVLETENELGTKEYRVKLIRTASIGSYSWDTSSNAVNAGAGINEWSQADLMKLLNPGYESNQDLNSGGTTITVNNSLYWSRGSGICYSYLSNATTTCDFTSTGLNDTAKLLIGKAKFYNNYVEHTDTSFNSATGIIAYSSERSTKVFPAQSDGIIRTTNWVGYVGLPTFSDYFSSSSGIATSEGWCGTDTSPFYFGNDFCIDYDWIYNGENIALLTPIYSNYYSYNYCIVGHVYNNGDSQFPSGGINGKCSDTSTDIRPVVYLKSSVKITGGKGTNTEPYTLSL